MNGAIRRYQRNVDAGPMADRGECVDQIANDRTTPGTLRACPNAEHRHRNNQTSSVATKLCDDVAHQRVKTPSQFNTGDSGLVVHADEPDALDAVTATETSGPLAWS